MVALYVGLDVSEETTSVCIVTGQGEVVEELSVCTDAKQLHAALRPYRRSIHIVGHESGPCSPYLHNELAKKRLPVICLDARQTRAATAAQRNKTDRNDARCIALLLSRGFRARAYVKSFGAQQLQTLLLFRRTLVQKLHDIDRVLGASVKLFGGKLRRSKRECFLAWPKSLQYEPVARYADIVLRARSLLDVERQALDALVVEAAKADRVCQRLMTMPGVGPVTALTFKANIDDPHRFPLSRDVGAYFGLTPRRVQSGNRDFIGRISKAGDANMRGALFQAAHSLLVCTRKSSVLRDWGLRVAARRGLTHARLSCSRKMAVILHRMWITERDFAPDGQAH